MQSIEEEADTDLLKALIRWLVIFIIATILFKMVIEWLYAYRIVLIVLGVIILTTFILIRIKRWRKRNRDNY